MKEEIKELTKALDNLLSHCSMISADKGEEIYNKLMEHPSVLNAIETLKKYTK